MIDPRGGARTLRVLVAMSGGVDSAVAAWLLARAGNEVAGATMRLFCYEREEGPPRPCCDMEAVREARRSAERIGIPHLVIDMEEVFRREVVGDFISEYARARTPNPCIRCNTYVKFGPLLEKAERMGFDAVATGHYARRDWIEEEGAYGLFRGRDPAKDQSYVLWGLPVDRLGRCLFPLGRARKSAVRRLAHRLGLAAWNRPESQDICFVPSGEHAAFLKDRLPADHGMRRPGPVRDIDGGGVLGQHPGLLGYTIGQRHGVGVASRERLYVVKIDPTNATLWLGKREAVRCDSLIAAEGSLLAPPSLLEGDGVAAKVRYRRPAVPCAVRILSPGIWNVRFPEGEGAVSPGQSIVFYRGERVIAGARIESARSLEVCPTPA